MEFSLNNPILYVIAAVIILVVIAQSVYFLLRAMKRAKEIGIAEGTVKKTIVSAILFTIAPAVAILVGIIVLSQKLGIALPWLRLSVIGSLTYETVAAETTLESLGVSSISNVSQYITVAWVMTFGIIAGIILVPLITKKIQNGMVKIELKDKKWSEILQNAMFLGMISAFLGYVFCDVTGVFHGELSGLIPVFVMIVSAIVMAVCGILSKKLKQRWITDYALPISLVCGMASAIPFTSLLG